MDYPKHQDLRLTQPGRIEVNQCNDPVRQLDVPARLSSLNYGIEQLEARVRDLSDRLATVRQVRPSAPSNKEDKLSSSIPPLSSALLDMTTKIRATTEHVEQILAELEI